MTITSDNKLMQLLGVSEIHHRIAMTNKGELTVMLRKGENRYRLVLDAVPLDDKIHDEVWNIIYPSSVVIPQVKKEAIKPIKKVIKKK